MPPDTHAWHEAGHALAAHVLGGAVRELSLESELDDHEGHVAVEWGHAETRDASRRSAVVALAGPVAELVFRGEEVLDDSAAVSAWRGDWDEAGAQLVALYADAVEREVARRGILRDLRTLFESARGYECLARIADALDAHVTLDDVLFAEAVDGLGPATLALD